MDAIYKPSGKAGEYAEWAASIFVGCSNGCEYCYLKKGVLAHAMGGNTPKLKRCFTDNDDAICTFKDELIKNTLKIRQAGGIFFTFTTDPCLPETWPVFGECARFAMSMGCPVTILTKCVDWLKDDKANELIRMATVNPGLLCIGFTLTGSDELEPNAATNEERIDAMNFLHQIGVKTFASIEPIVDFQASTQMIHKAHKYCDLFKVGLMTGGKQKITSQEVKDFVTDLLQTFTDWEVKSKIMFKESIIKKLDQLTLNLMSLHANVVDYEFTLLRKSDK